MKESPQDFSFNIHPLLLMKGEVIEKENYHFSLNC